MIEEILEQRGGTHGDFSENAECAQALKKALVKHGSEYLTDVQREALDNICQKMARIVCGDNTFLDSVRDIIGYAQLMYTELENLPGATDVKNIKLTNVKGMWVQA